MRQPWFLDHMQPYVNLCQVLVIFQWLFVGLLALSLLRLCVAAAVKRNLRSLLRVARLRSVWALGAASVLLPLLTPHVLVLHYALPEWRPLWYTVMLIAWLTSAVVCGLFFLLPSRVLLLRPAFSRGLMTRIWRGTNLSAKKSRRIRELRRIKNRSVSISMHKMVNGLGGGIVCVFTGFGLFLPAFVGALLEQEMRSQLELVTSEFLDFQERGIRETYSTEFWRDMLQEDPQQVRDYKEVVFANSWEGLYDDPRVVEMLDKAYPQDKYWKDIDAIILNAQGQLRAQHDMSEELVDLWFRYSTRNQLYTYHIRQFMRRKAILEAKRQVEE